MIVKIQKAGASFKSLGGYLADAKERVAWTYSLNCAHDDVLSVIDEMYTTFRDAEFLKDQAGIHAGGKSLENPVKHYSLSWHPSEKPTREEMIDAATSFLNEMGAEDHQAFLVAHNDMDHQHVHIMINRVHPERGTALNERFEKVRAQDWALDYEREHGNILCEQRLLDREERTPSPNRRVWEQLREHEGEFEREEAPRREYEPDYMKRDDQRVVINDHEWRLLRDYQREDREAHFADGKEAFKQVRNEIYLEVREQFRGEWAAYFEAKRAGGDHEAIADMRADILERQRAMLDERRDEACTTLRESRDQEYKDLLLEQKEERHELRARQEADLSSSYLLELVGHEQQAEALETGLGREGAALGVSGAFHAAAQETCEPSESQAWSDEPAAITPAENPRIRHGLDMAGDLGMGLLGALGTIGERLFDGFFGDPVPANQNSPKPEAKPRREPDDARDQSRARAVDAAIRAAEIEQEMRRDREYWRERERSRD